MPGWIDNIISKFSAGDALPWTDEEMIAECEREAAEDGAGLTNQTDRNESIMRLAWALVHSRRSVDVQRGIAMLGASLGSNGGPLQKREILYLLAVGHFRAGDYTRSRRLVDDALQHPASGGRSSVQAMLEGNDHKLLLEPVSHKAPIAPDFRQAVALRKMIEDKIAQDGAIGVGIAAAAVGIVASGVAALLIRKK